MNNQDKKNINFSIVVPVYNSQKWLKKCVNSILEQSYEKFELILVNDGSTDSSGSICDSYAQKDTRVKVIHKKNGGHNSARNAGFEAATGKYIVTVDSDDNISNSALEYFNDITNLYDDVDIIIFGYKQLKNGKLTDFPIKTKYNNQLATKEQLIKDVYPYMIYDPSSRAVIYAAGWNKVIKKDLLLKHCCKDYSIVVGGDFSYSFECCYYANSIYFLDKNLYIYNCDTTNSVSSGSTKVKSLDTYKYIKKRIANNKNIQEQLDADLVWSIEYLLERKVGRNTINKYKYISKLYPEFRVNDLMSKKQKFIANCLIKNKIKWLIGPSFVYYYKKLDKFIWKLFNHD